MGGALTAISPDFIQSALVVGGMNYSNLLTRSVDCRPTASIPSSGPTRTSCAQPLLLSLIQMLWDRERTERLRPPDDREPAAEHAEAQHHPDRRARRPPGVTNFASDVRGPDSRVLTTPGGGIDRERWPDYEATVEHPED